MTRKRLSVFAAALAAAFLAASWGSWAAKDAKGALMRAAHFGQITVTCTAATFSYTQFPQGASTAQETVKANGTVVYSGAFTVYGPSSSHTIPLSLTGRVRVEAHSSWTADGGRTADAVAHLYCKTPSTPPPPPEFHQPPGRWGYCDATGKFVDLVKGQTTDLPAGVTPPLRDADVDAIVDGQQVNARCDVKPPAPPAVVAVTPASPKPVLPARKTIVKPKAKPHPKPKHHAKPKPKKPVVCKPGTRLWHGSCHHLAYGKG